MMTQITMAGGNTPTLDPVTLIRMFAFRHKIFRERLGWDVTSDHGMEYDCFDELNPVYILAKDLHQRVEGCWRLLPTTGPYMLRDTFPELLGDERAPAHPRVWELSRFAVEPADHSDCHQASVNVVAMDMMRQAYEFAIDRGITDYVTVTSVALERLMKKAGVPLYRTNNGRAQKIGKVLTVACWIPINEELRQALYPDTHLTSAQDAA